MKMELIANHAPQQYKDVTIKKFVIAVNDIPYRVEYDPHTHWVSVYNPDTHYYMRSWSKLAMVQSFIKDTLLEMEIA